MYDLNCRNSERKTQTSNLLSQGVFNIMSYGFETVAKY